MAANELNIASILSATMSLTTKESAVRKKSEVSHKRDEVYGHKAITGSVVSQLSYLCCACGTYGESHAYSASDIHLIESWQL